MKASILVFLFFLGIVQLGAQSFSFSIPNTNFLLIPGGSFETSTWVTVPPGDSVVLKAYPGPGMFAIFQPQVVKASQQVFLVVVSTQAALPPTQSVRVSAKCGLDSVSRIIHIADANDGSGFYLIDSARYYFDATFAYLIASQPQQAAAFNSIKNLPWTASFPYPPLWIVTHHLFVSGNWRVRVLWHNMIPPDNWAKVFISNEDLNLCWGVNIDTYGAFSMIACEYMHYIFQDTFTYVPDNQDYSAFTVYPNPCMNSFHLRSSSGFTEKCSVELLNIEGSCLRREDLFPDSEELEMDIRDIPAGLYLLRISSKNEVNTLRLVKAGAASLHP